MLTCIARLRRQSVPARGGRLPLAPRPARAAPVQHEVISTSSSSSSSLGLLRLRRDAEDRVRRAAGPRCTHFCSEHGQAPGTGSSGRGGLVVGLGITRVLACMYTVMHPTGMISMSERATVIASMHIPVGLACFALRCTRQLHVQRKLPAARHRTQLLG